MSLSVQDKAKDLKRKLFKNHFDEATKAFVVLVHDESESPSAHLLGRPQTAPSRLQRRGDPLIQ